MPIPCNDAFNFSRRRCGVFLSGLIKMERQRLIWLLTQPVVQELQAAASTPSSVYSFFVDDTANAGNEMKLTVLASDVRTYSSSDTTYSYDSQMTYYADSDEYVFEFDTAKVALVPVHVSTQQERASLH